MRLLFQKDFAIKTVQEKGEKWKFLLLVGAAGRFYREALRKEEHNKCS